jgi:predicted dehydrogenase
MVNTLKIGLIGTGSIAQLHSNAYLEFPNQVKLTALCDINIESLKRFGDKMNVKDQYTDAEKMIKEADIDAVDICTIHDQHYSQVLTAIEAGKHVLCEKPMSISLQECFDMVKASEKEDLTFAVGQNLRYLPQTQIVKKKIDGGELGDIWNVQSWDLGNSLPPRSKLLDEPKYISWYFDAKRAGGGSLISQPIHHIDLFRYYIGDIKRIVNAKTWTDHPYFANEAEDRVAVTYEFENGALGYSLGGFTVKTPWNHRYIVYGETGTVASNPSIGGSPLKQFLAPVSISSSKPTAMNDFVPIEPDMSEYPSKIPYTNEILHFAECCHTGEEPISSGRDNLGTMKAIFAIYEAANSGKTVEIKN